MLIWPIFGIIGLDLIWDEIENLLWISSWSTESSPHHLWNIWIEYSGKVSIFKFRCSGKNSVQCSLFNLEQMAHFQRISHIVLSENHSFFSISLSRARGRIVYNYIKTNFSLKCRLLIELFRWICIKRD